VDKKNAEWLVRFPADNGDIVRFMEKGLTPEDLLSLADKGLKNKFIRACGSL